MVFGAQHTSAADDAPRWPGLNAFLVRRPRVPNGIPDGLSRIVRVTLYARSRKMARSPIKSKHHLAPNFHCAFQNRLVPGQFISRQQPPCHANGGLKEVDILLINKSIQQNKQ